MTGSESNIVKRITKSSVVVPAVSWLLCTHVSNKQLQLSIQSCLDQTFTDFELIVVVNGDSAKDVAASVHAFVGDDSRVRIFTTEVRHLIFSLNLGMHYAQADLIARMDGDDVSRPDRLELQVSYMYSHPEVDLLGTAYQIIDENDILHAKIYNPEFDCKIRSKLFTGNPICHPTVMFRRQVVLDVGGYQGGLHAEDYDLWSRLALIPSVTFHNLTDVCLSYRMVGIGTARHSRLAYSTVSAAQIRNFVLGAGWKWLFAFTVTLTKMLFISVTSNLKK